MARPRKGDGVPAKERLEDAFWHMLAEKPFMDMTISALSNRAGVNHNTFYYYYESLDDMAQKLLVKNLIPELPERVLDAFTGGQLDPEQIFGDEDILLRFRHLSLMAGSHGTAWMVDALKRAVMELWFDSFGIQQSDLDIQQEMILTFIISGLLAVVGEYGLEAVPSQFGFIMESGLGQGILASFSQISESTNAGKRGLSA